MTDEEIIELYFARKGSALEETASLYGAFLKAVSYRVLGRREDAEECVNETYLVCWNAVPPLRPRSLKAYLGAVCRNLSLDRYKRNKALKRGGGKTEILLSEIGDFLPAEQENRTWEGDCALSVIDDFLQTLTKEERVMFVRRYWFADAISEIAERTGFSESKVKSALFRLRKRLRERLEKEGADI